MDATSPISSRSQLLSLLSEACELEHGLLCSYLFAAFSLKQDLAEGGMTWQQQQKVRLWAAQIYAVAAEEMLHLSQAWNLLAAIGGMPYYQRPAFPQGARYYKLHLPLELEPFGPPSLKRFIMYELPSRIRPEDMAAELGIPVHQSPTSADLTVGELYGLVLSGFETIPEAQLFVGNASRQVGQEIVDFPDIIRVVDRSSARAAVEMITEQGEGTSTDSNDCHFGMFRQVLRDYEAEVQRCVDARVPFSPVRAVATNPRLRETHGKGSIIENPYTREVAELFDEIYGLMLRMLQFVFSNSTEPTDVLHGFARNAILTMTTVLKPLGEALTMLPLGDDTTPSAGPVFGISRHVALPTEPAPARVLVAERVQELLDTARTLAARTDAPVQLKNAALNFERCIV